MLIQISIKNFAVFNDITVDFKSGMSIITGESGAGKSVLVNAISLIRGSRAFKEMIRKDCDFAIVEAIFKLNMYQLNKIKEIVKDIEIEELLIITRKINYNQKSECRINGKIRNLSLITKISAFLIDIHGQYENQSLLNQEKHIEYLDLFSSSQLNSFKTQYNEAVYEYNKTVKIVTMNFGSIKERERDKEIYIYQINDIVESNVLEYNWENIYKKKKMMDNLENIELRLSNCLGLFDNSQYNILDNIYEGAKNLEFIEEVDDIKDIKESILNSYYLLSDNVKTLNNKITSLEFEESELETVNERINDIEKAKSKYGDSKEDINEYLNKLNEKLSYINDFQKSQKESIEKIELLECQLNDYSLEITNIRKENAVLLEIEIEKELSELEMKNIKFKIDFENTNEVNSLGYKKFYLNGNDIIEFYISTIKGNDMMPLRRIASGGEMSRIMLALKSILADKDNIFTVIFDEIDTGISGETSKVAGIKLLDLSKNKQVICITHLPQIVAKGNNHYTIKKNIENGETSASILFLETEDERINALAKLIDGNNVTKEGLLHAKEILK